MSVRLTEQAPRASLLALLVIASCGGDGTESPASPTPSPPTSLVAVAIVVTTQDQKSLMQTRPAVNFSAPSASSESADPIGEHTIVVDENQRYQTVVGFGAAFTDSSTYLLNRVATFEAREQAMNDLFTRKGQGIGLSAMRTTIGSSDLSPFHYTYNDMPQGQTDPTLSNFSIDVDRADRIPIIQQAKRLNPQMGLLASVWSPPAWMKTTDSLRGGSLLPGAYGSYANYFVKYLQAYQAEGITIDLLSRQNEPLFSPSDYPGMTTDAETQTVLLRDHILPALRTHGLSTKLLIYDHNWDDLVFPTRVLSDPDLRNSDQVAGTAWHWYGGTPGAMTALHNLFPAKGNYVTEASSGVWISDPVTNDFEMIIHSMRNWSKSFVKWGLALDENRGPHSGGCSTCTPLVTVNSKTGAVTYEIDYYTLGHFSKHVLPGAARIYSSNATNVVNAAFLNPDGSKALVAFNDSNAAKTFQVAWGSQSFSYTLPPSSGATFTWRGTQLGSYRIPAASKVQASSYNEVIGMQTETTSDADGGYNLGHSVNGAHAVYRNMDFRTGVTAVEARVANSSVARNGSTIDFHLDRVDGPLIASVKVPDTGGFQSWNTVSGAAAGASGIHDVYVVFKGNGATGNLNWFRFRSSGPEHVQPRRP
jgi:glucosylceramidase